MRNIWQLCPLLLGPLLVQGVGSTEEAVALAYLEKHRDANLQDLIELASIPSVSAIQSYSESCLNAAHWLQTRLKRAGLEKVHSLPTGTENQPVVYAEWLHAKGLPTVLIYGHYDVQPAEDTDLWDQPPFEPLIKDGYFYGRGTDDDKGGIVPVIQALEAYLQTAGKLPVNIKLLFEGSEEVGSPHLPAFLQTHKQLFSADFALSADGGQQTANQGTLVLALRGAIAFEVEAKTLERDVHSGTFGGTVQNPNHALSHFIADLHFPNGSISIPGFYDDVSEITEEDRKDLAAYAPYFKLEDHLSGVGATEAYGEEGFTTLERTWHRPTCDVVGQWGGFIGQGVKTIVPGKATAKVSCRLVANQVPEKILQLAKQHVEAQKLPGTTLTFTSLRWAAPPYSMPKDGLANRAAAKVLKDMLSSPPLYYRAGASIPAAAYMETYLGIKVTLFGFGLPSNNIHAPNERYGVDEFLRMQEGYVRILHEIAALSGGSTKEEL